MRRSSRASRNIATACERELGVICQMGFAGYFLIVADFIRWARANGVPVGPGRGSGAGSLVAYSLGITDIDPLKYDLLFERFLNPERVSMPDFDIDFCMDGRDRVIEYVSQKYGRERVSQIITYGTMAAKAVVRDVGRVLGMGYGYVDKIAKLIPFELGITLDDAIEKEPELKRLYKEDEEIKNLIDLARSLEGLTRNAGMHAGGVVIAPSKLTEFAPLYADDKGGSVVTQFDKDDVEAAGLVKFDFLGLRTLTVIDRAVKIINARRSAARRGAARHRQLPMDDQATYDLMAEAKTTAVFQLESRGMKDLIRRLKPDRFEDIVALVALFRPGPLESGMVGDFIDRKHSRNDPHAPPIDYLHPSLQPVLAPTYGVILYQEQVMQIAQVLAGYTLGGADLLRRAMGKKKPEEMAKQRGNFVSGAVKNNVPEEQAAYIFDLMEKFAGYGFNKSHSAAYALLSYQTGWLKTHEAASYMAAVLSADMDHTDKVVGMLYDCRKEVGLTVLPPHVNLSSYEFAVVDDKTIRYGLGAIKGVGEGAVEAIVSERRAHGDFASLEDLCRRLDLSKINRRVLEALIKSGSLDGLAANRATLMHRLDAALALGEQNSKANETGQHDIFGLSAAHVPEAVRATRAGSAGMDRHRAVARRARDAGPRDLRSPHRPLRERSAAVHHRPHRRLHRSREAPGQRRGRPRVLRRQARGDRRRGRGIAQARPAHRGGAGRRLRPHRGELLRRAVPAVPRDPREGRAAAHRRQGALRRVREHLGAARQQGQRARAPAREGSAPHRAQAEIDGHAAARAPAGRAGAIPGRRLPGGRAVLRRRRARHVFLRRRVERPAGARPDRRAREVVGPRPDRGAVQPAAGERRSDLHQFAWRRGAPSQLG